MSIWTGALVDNVQGFWLQVCGGGVLQHLQNEGSRISKAGTVSVSAWKVDTLPELWWCIEEMLTVPQGDGCDQLVDFVATQHR